MHRIDARLARKCPPRQTLGRDRAVGIPRPLRRRGCALLACQRIDASRYESVAPPVCGPWRRTFLAVALGLLLPPLMSSRRTRSGGFTLIELLVVVSIIGVLAAIALPTYGGRQGKAFDARVRQDARNAATGEEAYFLDQQTYFEGDCSLLPGVNLSPGVVCVASATGGAGFSIATSHPRATVTCTFASAGAPNLDCNSIIP